MWHTSVADRSGTLDTTDLRQLAERALRGVGNRIREWDELGNAAFHLRRRLTRAEQEIVGEAIDLRGQTEARERYEAMKGMLPPFLWEMAWQETGLRVRD